jgi:hypothetical protein
MDAKLQSKKGSDVAGRLLQKLLMPIVATAASAAAGYAAKKGPQLIDQKVAPKVRELMRGARAGSAGDVAEQLAGRARSLAGDAVSIAGDAVSSAGDSVKSATGANGHRHRSMSSTELERRREERKKGRAERRKTSR